MFKGQRGIGAISILIAILVTGMLTDFSFGKVRYYHIPYPPAPPMVVSINAWIFCTALAVCLFLAVLLLKSVRAFLLRIR
jgi:hypothetical protein